MLESWSGLIKMSIPHFGRIPGVRTYLYEQCPSTPDIYTVGYEAVTTAIRYPHSDTNRHFCRNTVSFSKKELAAITSAESLVSCIAKKTSRLLGDLQEAVYEMGLRILPVDVYKTGIPKITFDEHLLGGGI